jgi:hypothetical protein
LKKKIVTLAEEFERGILPRKEFDRLMAWYNATGKENDKSLYQERVIDRCKFCGQHKEIKTTMTIVFSEFEQSHGPICKDCYSANAIMVQDK